MRLWSIQPKYLDGKGVVALWRESLLAQKVLKGEQKVPASSAIEKVHGSSRPGRGDSYVSSVYLE